MSRVRPLLAFVVGALVCTASYLAAELIVGGVEIFLMHLYDPKFGGPLANFILLSQLALLESAICGVGIAAGTIPFLAVRAPSLRHSFLASSLAGTAVCVYRMASGTGVISVASVFIPSFVAGILLSGARLVASRGRTAAT